VRRFYAARVAAVAAAILVTAFAAYAGTSSAKSSAVTKTTTSIPGANKGNAPGVSAKTIKFAVFTQEKTCGTSAADQTTVAGTKERFNTLVKWVNSHIKLPGGRKLAVEFIDDGGTDPACADVAQAAITKAIDQDHVFAIFDDNYNPGINVADIVAKKHTLIIGWNFQTLHDLKTHAPYGWSTYEPGQISFEELTWMIQKRFKKNQYVADDGSKHARVWGELFTDNTLGHALANLTKGYMTQGGLSVKQYFISPVASTASQQASGLVLQMQQAGVNSLIYGADDLTSDLSFNAAATNAGYHPDFFISQYGTIPQLTVFVPYFGANFEKRLYGTGPPNIQAERVEVDSAGDVNPKSCPSCYGQDNGMNVAAVTAYEQAHGSAGDHPGIDSWNFAPFIWSDLMTLTMGAANAGPTLNAYTFQYGLEHGAQSQCMAQEFFGKQPYAQAAKFSFSNPPRNYLMSGFTTLHFNPNVKNAYGTMGLFESYDNYQLFNSLSSLPANPLYNTASAGGYKLVKQKGNITVNTKCG